MFHILVILKYLTCLRVWFPRLSYLNYNWKNKFYKFFWFNLKEHFEPTWTSIMEFLCQIVHVNYLSGIIHAGAATDCRITKFACRRTQIFLKSAKGRRINVCRSGRFIKNVCRSSQIKFTIQQKKWKRFKKLNVFPNISLFSLKWFK